MIKIKRIYDAEDEEGYRVLVDRLWPRGVSKEKANLDEWMKEVAPSDELRKWFNHEPSKWKSFKKKYLDELDDKQDLVQGLLNHAQRDDLLLLYAAKDEEHNNAVVLRELLESRLKN